MKVLIDTNVILDVWLAREPFWRDSVRVISAVESKDLVGVVAPTTVTTLHYLVKKTRGERMARVLLDRLLSICSVGVLRKLEIRGALESEVRDFEDAVIEAVAMQAKAEIIVTRNLADFKKSKVTPRAPSELEW